MLKKVIAQGARTRVVVMDSITQVAPEDAGSVVVAGSHGGRSAGEVALGVPLMLVFFNDAGIGKDDAGVAALAMLQARGVAAGTVAHSSARIGDARDAWEHGVVSRLNAAALALGLREGDALAQALPPLL